MKVSIPSAQRSPNAPILEARPGKEFWWEANGIFNAGATEYQGDVTLLYRAYDTNHISRLGLATSANGVDFTRYAAPAIDTNPDDPHERLGIEDPRITLIDDTYYILHTSASYHRVGEPPEIKGVGSDLPWRVRIGMHTTTDFHTYLHHGVILPDVPAKNATLLPRKINNAFGMLYRVFNEGREIVTVSYTKDFKEWFDTKEITLPDQEEWRGFKWGLGSQPIETKNGYLLVYHGVQKGGIYRLGLLLLDINDPSKVIWHSGPILEPETEYERVGYVPNVVYCCGAVIRNDELWIYYGGADRVMGRAILPLQDIFPNGV